MKNDNVRVPEPTKASSLPIQVGCTMFTQETKLNQNGNVEVNDDLFSMNNPKETIKCINGENFKYMALYENDSDYEIEMEFQKIRNKRKKSKKPIERNGDYIKANHTEQPHRQFSEATTDGESYNISTDHDGEDDDVPDLDLKLPNHLNSKCCGTARPFQTSCQIL